MNYDTIMRLKAHDSFANFWYTYMRSFDKKTILSRYATIDYVDQHRVKYSHTRVL